MSTKLKLLIVGGSGFVGSSLAKAFVKKFQVFCTYHRSFTPIKDAAYLPLPKLSEKDRCDRFINSVAPDVVIYCLGTNNEIEAEKDPRESVNIHSNGINHLMHSTDLSKAKFIYISSDFVFSGIDGNFAESDSTIPTAQLGKSKSGAEGLIKTRSLNHLIIRCAPLMGRGTLDHPSWLDLIRQKMMTEKKVQSASRYIHNPVHISFLIDVLEKAINKDLRNKILHVGGLTKVSNFDFTKRFVQEIGLSAETVECSDTTVITSPSDYSLNFTETLKLVEAQPLFLEQSFDLLK